MKIIRHRAWPRAGLIGNPSDGYGGRTISFTFRNFAATVVLYEWDQVEILWSEQDKSRFASVDELVEDVILNGYYGGVRLIKATIKRFVEFCRRQNHALHREPFSIRYSTTIPRGVGLSGSSAIVVATLRCLLEFYGVQIAPAVQASLARAVENDELGIACGYQDRVAQVYEGLVAMDFSQMEPAAGFEVGRYERLDTSLLPPLYLAFDVAAAKTSDSVHGRLRTRLRDNSRLAETMREIADLVPQAREALEHHDYERLAALMNRNFDLRSSLYDIRPDHRAMIDTARSAGVSAKFAGSGGTIVGSYTDQESYDRLCAAMTAQNPDWRVFQPILDP